MKDLIQDVYRGWEQVRTSEQWRDFVVRRAILAPTNDNVNEIANEAMKSVRWIGPDGDDDGRPTTFYSADSVVETELRHHYPVEYLNSLEFPGVPPHAITLARGTPVVLIRNLAQGLKNGTRMIVASTSPTLLKVELCTGPMAGQTTYIPRLGITPSDVDSHPFTLRRRQFPVLPAYAMTINRAQGQTLDRVGIYLPKPVFSHGQLYVALSRTGNPEGVSVLVPGQEGGENGVMVKNVVWREVFDHLPDSS